MGQAYTVPADACPGPVNCIVIFGKNDEILRLGDIGPGDFVGDPDFAGAGVRTSFYFYFPSLTPDSIADVSIFHR